MACIFNFSDCVLDFNWELASSLIKLQQMPILLIRALDSRQSWFEFGSVINTLGILQIWCLQNETD